MADSERLVIDHVGHHGDGVAIASGGNIYVPYTLGGETIEVGHPESMSIPEDQQDLFVTWDKSGWNLLDASQVARISVSKRSPKH